MKFVIGEKKPSNIQEFEQFGKAEWEKIPPEKYRKLINGYKKCFEAVITAKGCVQTNIKY